MGVNSWDSDNLTVPQKHLSLSEAYIQASIILCTELVKDPDTETYEKGCVVMFNARLGVELFLKAALLKINPGTKLHHDIDSLALEYSRLYPEDTFRWSIPFTSEKLGAKSKEELNESRKRLRQEYPQDQALRYPINKQKEEWAALSVFSAIEFMPIVMQVKSDVSRLKVAIFS